jgi:hypothetical protein
MVSCAALIGAASSRESIGSAGKYRSVVSGCSPSSKARASATTGAASGARSPEIVDIRQE